MELRHTIGSCIAIAAVILGNGESWAITVGEPDTFATDLEGWGQGQPPMGSIGVTRPANGGPNGAGDAFMIIRSDSSSTHGKIVALNRTQWAGDYITAGVTAISMSVNNLSFEDLNLRLSLGNNNSPQSPPFTSTWFASSSSIDVPASSGWISIEFPLGPDFLQRTHGSASYADVMSGVVTLRLLHSPLLEDQGAFITADLGVDNILALGPEILVGDYNNDVKVSAADFTVWRDHFGAATLENRDPDNVGSVGDDDFDSWLENYGATFEGSGAGAASIPEPSSIAMLVFAALMVAAGKSRRY